MAKADPTHGPHTAEPDSGENGRDGASKPSPAAQPSPSDHTAHARDGERPLPTGPESRRAAADDEDGGWVSA